MKSLSKHITEALSDVDKEPGKMHKVLGINQDERILDYYTDGKKLAQDLYDKLGDKKEVAGMLAYAANIDSEKNVFDDALKSLDEINENR
jgi:hypothetical protein